MFKNMISVMAAGALLAACATPETRARYNVALENCLASEDVTVSNECKKAELLREQVEIEKDESASLALGVATVGFFTLATIAIFDDCCYGHKHYGYRYRGYKHKHYRHGHRGRKFHRGGGRRGSYHRPAHKGRR